MTKKKGTKNPIPQTEQSFEIGKDEFWSLAMANLHNNTKRTFDEYQHESLESIRRNRAYVDKVLSDAQQHDNAKQTIAEQALQNAVETANMVSKQAVRHGDIAIDRQWNLDAETMQAIVAKVTAEMAAEKKK